MATSTIKINKITQSNIGKVDFKNLKFGKEFSDHMFEVDFDGNAWVNPIIRPIEKLSIHPANLAWHYGQSIFEGMKASLKLDGTPVLFRTDKHIERLNNSAERMCMPKLPENLFMEALNLLIDIEKEWIPKEEGSALYIRPLMIATDEFIGVRPSSTYKFLIMCLPVGPYYSKPVSLKVAEKYVRAINGGVGEAKTAGNYAASLFPAKLAKEEGFDQIMWLDGKEFKYIQEVGTMNIFFVVGDKIVTPLPEGAILKGITRDSTIKILRHKGFTVEEKPIEIAEIVKAYDSGELSEVFGTGTAAVVAQVSKIHYKGENLTLTQEPKIGPLVKKMINNIRNGSETDQWNWIQPVKNQHAIA